MDGEIGFVHPEEKELSRLNEGTGDGVEIGLARLSARCRISGGHHKVLQKLRACRRLPRTHLPKIKLVFLTANKKQNSLY